MDHLAYFGYLDMEKTSTVKTKFIEVYRNHETLSNFQKDVVNSVNEITFNNDLFGDPNQSYDKLENAIINVKIIIPLDDSRHPAVHQILG